MKINEPVAGGHASSTPARKLGIKKVLIALITFLILFLLLPMEIGSIKAKTFIYPIMWIGMGYFAFNAFPKGSIIKSLLIVSLGIIGFFYTLTNGTGFCGWMKHGTFYINKSDKSTRIVCRTYDCFGTAEDCRLFKVKRITKHIKWVTKFEEEPVDTTKWQSVPFMSAEYDRE